jgi:hypothetical protein
MAGLAVSWPVKMMKGLAGPLVEYFVRAENMDDPTASGEAIVPAGNHNLVLPLVAVGHYKVYVKGRDDQGNDTTEEWMGEVNVIDGPLPPLDERPDVEAPVGVEVKVIP